MSQPIGRNVEYLLVGLNELITKSKTLYVCLFFPLSSNATISVKIIAKN